MRFYFSDLNSMLCFWTMFVLQIHAKLVKTYVIYCCDRKSRAACAQSYTPWQQATIEITRRDHSRRRLNSARPPHPGHSTILLCSEIPSGTCAKLRTVAASNNRVHMPWSLYYCLFAPHTYIFVLRAHPVRGESHNQRNTNGEVATLQ